MTCAEWADEIARRLECAIARVPNGFYDSFEYTRTGRNTTHPVTWASLTLALAALPEVATVGIDVRLNLGHGIKFQPDIVGWNAQDELAILIDYESPNSSDARIPVKDVDAFRAWQRACGSSACYIIVTTLPDRPTSKWELRHTSAGQYNHMFRGRRAEVQANPCGFWYRHYREAFAAREMKNVALVNIDSRAVHRMLPQ